MKARTNMIQKLADALGVDLTKQVTDKLGDIQLGIVNDGTLVPALKHDNLKGELSTLQTKYKDDMADLNTKLGDLSKAGQTAEALQTAIDDLKLEQTENAEKHETAMKQLQMDNALDMALAGSDIKKGTNSIKAVKALIDLEEAIVRDGKIVGLEEQLISLKESDSYLFDIPAKKGAEPAGGIPAPTGDKAALIAAYDSSTDYVEKIAIQEKITALG